MMRQSHPLLTGRQKSYQQMGKSKKKKGEWQEKKSSTHLPRAPEGPGGDDLVRQHRFLHRASSDPIESVGGMWRQTSWLGAFRPEGQVLIYGGQRCGKVHGPSELPSAFGSHALPQWLRHLSKFISAVPKTLKIVQKCWKIPSMLETYSYVFRMKLNEQKCVIKWHSLQVESLWWFFTRQGVAEKALLHCRTM